MDEVLGHYACTFENSFDAMAKVNMYVYLKFGENWTTNMGDMAKSLFLQFFLFSLLFLFLFLNPTISKNVRGTGLKFANK